MTTLQPKRRELAANAMVGAEGQIAAALSNLGGSTASALAPVLAANWH